MKATGIRFVSFKDKQDPTKMVNGVTVFGSYPITKNGEGEAVERFFLSDWFIQNRMGGEIPKLGDEFEPTYNRSGKLADFRILSPTK